MLVKIRLRIDESANIDDAFYLIEVANFCFDDGDTVKGDEPCSLLGGLKGGVGRDFAEIGVIIERRDATGEEEQFAGAYAVGIRTGGSWGVGQSMTKILDVRLNE